jgi:glucose/arabinose dehydrogenase
VRTLLTVTSIVAVMIATVHAQAHDPKPAFPGQTKAPAPSRPSAPFRVDTIATALTGAWAVAFLPDGRFLVTQNGGTMRVIRGGRCRGAAGDGSQGWQSSC